MYIFTDLFLFFVFFRLIHLFSSESFENDLPKEKSSLNSQGNARVSSDTVTAKCRLVSSSIDKTYTNVQASNISMPVCGRGNQDLERHYENNFKAFKSSVDGSCFLIACLFACMVL